MSSIAARIWSQQIVSYVPHTSVSGDSWSLVKRGTTTSAGAAGGTTLVDTGADSGGADTYNGAYWVKILSGTNQGLWKRITDDDGSGTLTLENNGFPNQVASAVEYEIWLSPDPVVKVDSSSGETDMVDATRSEADLNTADFWLDYYAIPITGNRRGKIAKITGFTPGTGTFVLAAGLGGALAAGDVVLLRKFIEAGGLALGPTEDYLPRPQNRVNMSRGDGAVGARAGTVNFNTQIVGTGSLAAAASVANSSPAHGLFQACGLEETVATSAAVGAGSTTTAVTVATGTWERFVRVGMAVMWNGNVSFITAITDGGGGVDTLTVSPALPVAPAASDTLYAGRMYELATDADTYGALVEVEVDGVRTTFTGCKGNVEITDAAIPEFAFTLSADHWTREVEAAPYVPNTAYHTTLPVLQSDRIAYLDSTKVDVKGFTATPGTAVSPKMVQGSSGINGRAGYQVTGYAPGGTWREIVLSGSENIGRDSAFLARTAYALAVVYGSHGKCIAVRMPVAKLIQSPHPEDADGIMEHPAVFEAQDAGMANDGASTSNKVPDWALHIF